MIKENSIQNKSKEIKEKNNSEKIYRENIIKNFNIG